MVEYEVRGHIALLTLNRPEARNAVNDVVAQAMTENLDKAEADDDVWVIVLAADWDDEATIKKNTGEAFTNILSSEDTAEGLTAFIEKRAPQWKAR